MRTNNNSEHFRSQVKKASLTSILSSIVSNSQYKQPRDVFEPLDVDIVYVPDEFFSSMTPSVLAVTDFLVYQSNVRKNVFISQAYVGRTLGLARETVNRAIKTICSLGIFKKIYRSRKTCIYRIDQYLLDPETRAKLSRFLPALKRLPIFNVTLLKDYTRYIYQVTTCKIGQTWNHLKNGRQMYEEDKNLTENDIDKLTGTKKSFEYPKRGNPNSFFSRSDSYQHQHTVHRTNKQHLNGVNPYQVWKPMELPPENKSALEKYPQFAYRPEPTLLRNPFQDYKLDEEASKSPLAHYFNLFQKNRLE
jgi:hypothetical protein